MDVNLCHTFRIKHQHFNLIVMVSFQIQSASVQSYNNEKWFTTYILHYTPTSTHRLTAPTRSTFHCTRFGLEFLSDPHCSSAILQYKQWARLTERQTGAKSEHFHSHWVIWSADIFIWLGMEVKLLQQGKSHPLCGLFKYNRQSMKSNISASTFWTPHSVWLTLF